MKNAKEIKNMTPTFLDLLEPKIEEAAKQGKTSLDLFIRKYTFDEETYFLRKTLDVTSSNLEELKAKGFRVEVVATDYIHSGFLWRKKTIKRQYYTIYW